MSDIYKEFGVDFLRTRYAGPTAAEMKMARIHLRRAGMNRPSAELHEAALAELRADNERLRARVEKLEKVRDATRFLINEDAGVDDPAEDGWWEWEKNCEALRAALKEAKP
jgi:hypothetical protein